MRERLEAALEWGGVALRLSAGGMTADVLENGETRLSARLLPKQSILERYALLHQEIKEKWGRRYD